MIVLMRTKQAFTMVTSMMATAMRMRTVKMTMTK